MVSLVDRLAKLLLRLGINSIIILSDTDEVIEACEVVTYEDTRSLSAKERFADPACYSNILEVIT